MSDPQPIRTFFFGDSICVGQHVSIHRGWVPRISARLSELGEERGREILVTNASANGRITRQALESMPYEVQSQGPDVVIVQFGMNDCNYWQSDGGLPRVSPKSFAANLEEIVERAYAFGAQRVLLNTNHPTALDRDILPHAGITYQESNARYNAVIRDVAAALGDRVVLNDIERTFEAHVGSSRDRLLELLRPAPDLLHLSEKGHDLYFLEICPKLEAVIEEILACP